MLSPRQQKIKDELSDLLKTLQYTKQSEDDKAEKRIIEVVEKVDQIVQGELDAHGVAKNKENYY